MYKYILILLAGVALACNNPINPQSKIKDKFNEKAAELKQQHIYDMPKELDEISGISFINDSLVTGIEDENGILYFYNLKEKKITRQLKFGDIGDYEDLAIVGKDIYIINSSGVIYQIKNFESETPITTSINTPLSKKNDIESIAYQPKKNRLLIGVKGRNLDKSEDNKQVYPFDLTSLQLDTKSVYSLNVKEIEKYFKGDAIEETSKKFLKALGNQNISKVFHTSSMTVNPENGDIMMLSSLNNILAILSESGDLKKVYIVDGKDFRQPEGIAFSPNGKLYISNESGGKGSGNIIEMKYAN
ncbi:MAG: SdiA-regulated domain-containing protein [Daejeonella sp.]